MKKLFPLFSPYTFVFGSIVVYPRSRKDHFKRYLSYAFEVFPPSYARFSNVFSLIFLSNLNYLFVSFFIRFSMISGQCPDPIETVACSFQGLCYIDSLFSVSIFQRRPFGRHIMPVRAHHSTFRSNFMWRSHTSLRKKHCR